MDIIGIDLHKRESQLCILHAEGTVTERRIVTSRERFTAVLGNVAPGRVLLEATTESEWVARSLWNVEPDQLTRRPDLPCIVSDFQDEATRAICVRPESAVAETREARRA